MPVCFHPPRALWFLSAAAELRARKEKDQNDFQKYHRTLGYALHGSESRNRKAFGSFLYFYGIGQPPWTSPQKCLPVFGTGEQEFSDVQNRRSLASAKMVRMSENCSDLSCTLRCRRDKVTLTISVNSLLPRSSLSSWVSLCMLLKKDMGVEGRPGPVSDWIWPLW